ncbi:MAG: LysR family transcriptional regulator [Hyphomicrobiales bacterium]|nr:MAG: LysR family transcriptional regulator [Hyphomicrobiales bacterium]
MKRIAITIKKMEHALALQRWESFSRAAEELGVTQSTLSRSIASLEELWSVRIFERRAAGVRPTAIGADMLRQAERLIGLARTLESNMQLHASAMAGPVAFGMSGLMSTVFMPGILAFISERSPDLQVTTRIEPLSVLLDYLRNDEIEFAVYVEGEATADPAFTSHKIGEMPINLIVRGDHPLSGRTKPEWDDLKGYPVVCSTYLRMGHIGVTPTIICDSFSVARDFMLGSDAIWLSSRFVVRDELAEGIAKEIQPRGYPEDPTANIWVTAPVNRTRSPAGKLIIDFLETAYREMTRAG